MYGSSVTLYDPILYCLTSALQSTIREEAVEMTYKCSKYLFKVINRPLTRHRQRLANLAKSGLRRTFHENV